MDAHSNIDGRSAQRNAAPPRRTIGLWTATALVVGNMIGSGVFLLPTSDTGPAVAASDDGSV
jgi:APA family basic amino acid/polyamine antiporter